MATYNSVNYTDYKNLCVKDGRVRFGAGLAAAMSTSDDKAIYVRGSNLYYWNGTSETNLGAGGTGGATSWEDLFADDTTFSVTSGTFTIAGDATVGSADVLTLTAAATVSGDVIQITNSGTGSDIKGTSDTWSISKAGLASFATNSVIGGILKLGAGAAAGTLTSNGAFDLLLETNSGTNSSTINITDGANGDVTFTMNGTGKVEIKSTTETNVALAVTNGDVSVADGSVTVVDDDNAAASFSLTNNTATTTGSASSLGVVNIVSTSLTTGALVNLELTEGTLNGGSYLRAWDVTGGSAVFTVAEDGVTTIAGVAAGSNSIVVTSGDIFLSDTDGAKFESEDGTTTMFTLDNKLGVVADDSAVLLIDAGGAVASGGNLLRVAPTGTPNAGAIGIEYVGASKAMTAMVIDGDPAASSLVTMNGGGALTDGLAVLALTNDGNLATGGNILNITMGGTPHAAACAFEIVAAKDARAVDIASSAATASAFRITGAGATANDTAVMEIISSGTPANAGSNVLRVAFTGTATNKPTMVELVGTGKDVSGLYSVTDNTTTHGVSIAGAGALATGGRMLKVTNTGTPAANTDAVAEVTFGGTATNNPVVLNVNNGTADALPLLVTSNVAAATRQSAIFVQDSATGAIEPLMLKQDDEDQAIMKFSVAVPGAGTTVTTDDKSGGAAVYVKVMVNSTAYWIKATAGA